MTPSTTSTLETTTMALFPMRRLRFDAHIALVAFSLVLMEAVQTKQTNLVTLT
jgi:hypothetical protein